MKGLLSVLFHFNKILRVHFIFFILVRLRVKASLRSIAADPARTRVSTREKKTIFLCFLWRKCPIRLWFWSRTLTLEEFRRFCHAEEFYKASSISFLLNAPYRFSFFKDSFVQWRVYSTGFLWKQSLSLWQSCTSRDDDVTPATAASLEESESGPASLCSTPQEL